MNTYLGNRRLHVAILLALCGVACRDPDVAHIGDTGGTVVIATTSDPDALFPPFAMNLESRQATELMYEYLADVGPAMNTIGDAGFVKELASGWKWSADSSSIAFAIDPRARWHDGVRVSAHDVAFTFSIGTDSSISAGNISSLADIDSVTERDSATAVFWFKRRTPREFYIAASQMLILPSHILESVPRDSLRTFAAAHDPVGSGRYRLASWNRGSSLELRAVENHYRGRAGPDRIIWSVTPEYQSAVASLLAGAADVFPTMRRESIDQIKSGDRFNLISLPGMDYVFLDMNLRSPSGASPHALFASRDVRRALTMALDRRAMVRNLFDTLANVSIGPTVRAYPTTDTAIAQIPFDPAASERLLDSIGWKKNAVSGIRMKDGHAFSFSMLVPVSSLSRMRIAVLIQEQLRRVGIDAQIEQMDFSAFGDRQASRKFDAALASWHLESDPTSLRDTWTTTAAGKGGLNYGSYTNPEFDANVDSALSAQTVDRSKVYLRRANQIIVDDAPAVWLYEPRTIIAVSSRIRTTPMRPSAWWVDIASWRIPRDKRIARDAAVTASH